MNKSDRSEMLTKIVSKILPSPLKIDVKQIIPKKEENCINNSKNNNIKEYIANDVVKLNNNITKKSQSEAKQLGTLDNSKSTRERYSTNLSLIFNPNIYKKIQK